MDFTPKKYAELLTALRCHNHYEVKHDVDLYPDRSLRVAKLEAEMGLTTTYYFRARDFQSAEAVIRSISQLGHRVGYHYECLTTTQGDIEAAYDDFCRNLQTLRNVAEVSTACAHGSPRSKWNSQDIWNQYDIHSLGIDYEPMLDTDFARTLYLTDTGRRWDGYKVSVRDKVSSQQRQWQAEGLVFHSTDDIVRALRNPKHPIHQKHLLINTHPQRWLPMGGLWAAEAVSQWWKNQAKRLIVRRMQ